MPGILVSDTNGSGNYPESFFKVQCRLCSALHIQVVWCSQNMVHLTRVCGIITQETTI